MDPYDKKLKKELVKDWDKFCRECGTKHVVDDLFCCHCGGKRQNRVRKINH